jgi:hypothetical protein
MGWAGFLVFELDLFLCTSRVGHCYRFYSALKTVQSSVSSLEPPPLRPLVLRRRHRQVIAAAAVRVDVTLLNHVDQAVLSPTLLARHLPPNRLVPEWFAMFLLHTDF